MTIVIRKVIITTFIRITTVMITIVVYICIHIYVCKYMYIYVYLQVNTYIYVNIYIYIYIYLCICLYCIILDIMYMYIYTHYVCTGNICPTVSGILSGLSIVQTRDAFQNLECSVGHRKQDAWQSTRAQKETENQKLGQCTLLHASNQESASKT